MNSEKVDKQNPDEYIPEKLLKKWRDEAMYFSNIHDKYAKEFGLKSKILTFLSILMSSIVGITSFVQTKEWVNIITGCISILSAILQSLHKYLKFEVLEVQHKNLSIKYYSLAEEILYDLTEKKDQLDKITEDIKNRLENLLKSSPNGIS